jgi:hypothetical protein
VRAHHVGLGQAELPETLGPPGAFRVALFQHQRQRLVGPLLKVEHVAAGLAFAANRQRIVAVQKDLQAVVGRNDLVLCIRAAMAGLTCTRGGTASSPRAREDAAMPANVRPRMTVVLMAVPL